MARLSPAMESEAMKLLMKGTSQRLVATKLKVAQSTISRYVQSLNRSGSTGSKSKKGRKSLLQGSAKTKFKALLLRNKKLGSKRLASKVTKTCKVSLAPRTIRKYSAAMGLKWGTPKKTRYLTDSHRKKRLAFAKKYQNVDVTPYIFTDEKVFFVTGPRLGERYEEGHRPEMPTKAHSGKVNVWWGVSNRYNIKPYLFSKNMDAQLYVSILECRLPSKEENDWIFVRDNDSKHTSHLAREWESTHCPEVISDWPPYSPDLNIIENLWGVLTTRVYEKPLKSVATLERKIKTCIAEVTDEEIQNLVSSYNHRLRLVIKAKGDNIPY